MSTPRLYRLDCPKRGVVVTLLHSTEEGWVKVKSLLRQITYETKLHRLHPC